MQISRLQLILSSLIVCLSLVGCFGKNISNIEYLSRHVADPVNSPYVKVLQASLDNDSHLWIKMEFMNSSGNEVAFDPRKFILQDSDDNVILPSYKGRGLNRASKILTSELPPGTVVAGPMRGKLFAPKTLRPGRRSEGILIFRVDDEFKDKLVMFFPSVKDTLGESIEMAPVVLEISPE